MPASSTMQFTAPKAGMYANPINLLKHAHNADLQYNNVVMQYATPAANYTAFSITHVFIVRMAETRATLRCMYSCHQTTTL